ncbi:protein kinase domain-containing protein [Actinophytocola gossypii]|uniref:non-specific serine/threonine protein kinase n=1 Tax=Actinophytocola gossypii TaxID=2812003 RepID=A0ABT2JGN7_9PSEU|nr:protein kinase [Actinophytocola gossypii]MCT2586936.1 protein kinase [Actinophytocola gossypii]
MSAIGWRQGATVLGEFTVERDLGRVTLVRDGERYGVTRIPAGDLVAQRRLLTELRRWAALPAHPHLTACRFVRATGDELFVLTDHAPGGSLAARIGDGSLYAGDDPTATVPRVAAEIAWGLDAAHAMGVPHLGLTPDAVLFTGENAATLTWFGIAPAAAESAYSAPEQAGDQPVGPGADVWSWAVIVLEMFAGERSWPSAALADAVLEQLVAQRRWRVEMPSKVAEVLRECLRFDPTRRPASLRDVAAALTDQPPPQRPSVLDSEPGDPRAWLTFAYETAGLDPRTATVFWPGERPQEEVRAFAVARRVLDQAGTVWARARLRADAGRAALRHGDTGTGVAHLLACADLLADRTDEDSRLLLAAVRTDLAPHDDPGRAVAVAAELTGRPEVLGAALLAQAGTLGDPNLYAKALAAYERAGDAAGAARSVMAKAKALDLAGAPDLADRLLAGLQPDDPVLAGRIALDRAGLARRPPAAVLAHALAAVARFAPLVREHGRHELAGDLGLAWSLAAAAHADLGRPGPAWDAYRAARVMLAAAVVRDGRDDLADELATVFDHEATLARELAGARAGAEAAGRAVELWRSLGERGDRLAELATARERYGTALMEAGDTAGAREQFDAVLRLVPESEVSSRWRTLAAMAHRQHGVLLRRAGDPVGACGRYQHALYLLADADDSGFTRVLVLESLSGALGDAGHLDESVQVLRQSSEELAMLVTTGVRGEADLADSTRRLAGALLELGDFPAARETALAGLAHYGRLIAGGRDDLVVPAARLRATYGYVCHRLSDVDGAVAAISEARAVLGADAVVARGLDAQLAVLRAVAALRPEDLDGWFAEQRVALSAAAALSRSGRTREASRQGEEILGSLGWLTRTLPTEQGYALCGRAGVHLGMWALHARRNGAARHGFAVAAESFGTLVDNGLRQYVEDWARAYVGTASLLTVLGDDGGAEDAVAELLAIMADVDGAAVPEWRERAARVVAEMRSARG